ncbi:hypothetical protein HMPREF0742_01536 [Rothia aeria F0184]|uniref:Uncharacterized protein n=1 Tax=Rothia aeria F0184 TaxID=888019 RepID=U7V437_9MICC|nr:hypothetical protein HMPREF0742_01536 [Rothia aeria F0184]
MAGKCYRKILLLNRCWAPHLSSYIPAKKIFKNFLRPFALSMFLTFLSAKYGMGYLSLRGFLPCFTVRGPYQFNWDVLAPA